MADCVTAKHTGGVVVVMVVGCRGKVGGGGAVVEGRQ